MTPAPKPSKVKKKKRRVKPKLMPLSKLDKLTWKITSLAFRIDDADERGYCNCATCGKQMYYYKSDSQMGHFCSRRFKHTKFLRKNNSTQDTSCNKYRYGEQYKMGKFLDKKYGEGTADSMVELSKNMAKFTREDYRAALFKNAKFLLKVSEEKNLQEWRESLAKWELNFLANLEEYEQNPEKQLNGQRI